MRARNSLVVFWLMVAVVLLVDSAIVRAEPPAETGEDKATSARRLYEEGLARYNIADYTGAIELFREAYLLTTAPELLFNIAQAHRLSGPGHCRLALHFYTTYLRSDPKTTKRAQVESAITDMSRCAVDEPAAGEGPPSPRSEPAPTPTRTVDAAKPPPASTRWPWVVGGVGTGITVVGGGFLAWAHVRHDAIESSGCAPSCDPSRLEAPRVGQVVGGVALVTGAVLVATSLVLWLVERSSHEVRETRGFSRPSGLVFSGE